MFFFCKKNDIFSLNFLFFLTSLSSHFLFHRLKLIFKKRTKTQCFLLFFDVRAKKAELQKIVKNTVLEVRKTSLFLPHVGIVFLSFF